MSLRSRKRLAALLLTMTVFFVAIAGRLVTIQGISANHYMAIGLAQSISKVSLPGQRGTIFDRNGNELALSIPQTTVWADPKQVTQPEQEAEALGPVIGYDPATVQAELVTNSQFVYLARTVDDAVAAQVTALHLTGVYTMPEPKRFQPASPLASSLLGMVGIDNTGLSGLEQEYNQQLAGRPGQLIEEQDTDGVEIPGGLKQDQPAVSGDDLVLTIDEPLQAETEQALAAQITATKARSGIAAVMDTQTGELLAVASLTTIPTAIVDGQAVCAPAIATTPSSVATAAAAATPALPPGDTPAASCPPGPTPSSTAFTTIFEPGSMSKLVTISGALEEGVVVPSDHFSVPDSIPVSDTVIHDAESHPVEDWSVTDILANSSNVGTVTIAERLGQQRLANELHAFGFGQPSGVDFPGESAGLLPAVSQWSATSLATIAIGQGVGVTAIQMLAAYNTIANGGVYVAPKLVAATVNTAGVTQPTAPSPQRRVVSAQVAAEMNTMLGEVVRVGTGQEAQVSGYTVAGKTGTAQIPLQNARGYMTGVYDSSFAGFVPAEHPDLTAIVVLDETPDYGAVASAPVFGEIAADGLRDFKIAPVPAQPSAPGVPLATPQTAQAAGEVLSPTGAVPATAAGKSVVRVTNAPTTTTSLPAAKR